MGSAEAVLGSLYKSYGCASFPNLESNNQHQSQAEKLRKQQKSPKLSWGAAGLVRRPLLMLRLSVFPGGLALRETLPQKAAEGRGHLGPGLCGAAPLSLGSSLCVPRAAKRGAGRRGCQARPRHVGQSGWTMDRSLTPGARVLYVMGMLAQPVCSPHPSRGGGAGRAPVMGRGGGVPTQRAPSSRRVWATLASALPSSPAFPSPSPCDWLAQARGWPWGDGRWLVSGLTPPISLPASQHPS